MHKDLSTYDKDLSTYDKDLCTYATDLSTNAHGSVFICYWKLIFHHDVRGPTHPNENNMV